MTGNAVRPSSDRRRRYRLAIPPSAGLASTWLIITSPWRIAKIDPFASSWIARPDRFRSWPAISGGGSPFRGTLVQAIDGVQLDERHGRHRQVEGQRDAAILRPDPAERLESLETVGFTKPCPACEIRP